MEEAARKFARRILMIHLALLLAVIGIIYAASREVYDTTREQALKQAEARQLILAGQTAKGIEAFYKSILNDLDLLRQAPADEDEGAVTSEKPTTSPTAPPNGIELKPFFQSLMGSDSRTGNTVTARLYASILWKQLQGRVSLLFRVDRDRLGKGKLDRELLHDRGPIQMPLSPVDPKQIHPREIVARSMDWLRAVDKPTIGPFQQITVGDKTESMNLVAVPTPERNRLIVAAVPIAYAQKRFIEDLNRDGDSTNAILADETGTIMIGTNPQLVGREVQSLKDPEVMRLATDYAASPTKAVRTIEREYVLGGQKFPPGLVAIEPVSVGGKKWMLMIITPLSDVDMVVSQIFRRAVYWAIFVVFSMTAILVSSSIQLIRGRIRLERIRHDVINKELKQAREIQMAWLPQQGVSIPSIDIAAINHPASHISGDFYNWFELPGGRMVVTIGDVTGHGMSAAFLMATTQLLVHTTMLRLQDPGRTLTEVNRQLCMQVFNGQFVTMLICVLDVDGQSLEVATAGHYPPLISREGRFEGLAIESQLVLGVEKESRYPTERFILPASASLVMYTDGVLDVRSPEGKRFEMRRLIDSVHGRAESAQSLIDSIVGHVNHFRGNRPLPDDLTMVCIQTQTQPAEAGVEAIVV